MNKELYTWDDLYERAEGKGCGDPELKAKDNARWKLAEIIKEEYGIDIEECESPEEEIDWFLDKNDIYLFDKDGHFVEKQKRGA